jgi:hypothetical protein
VLKTQYKASSEYVGFKEKTSTIPQNSRKLLYKVSTVERFWLLASLEVGEVSWHGSQCPNQATLEQRHRGFQSNYLTLVFISFVVLGNLLLTES